jgi:hypothetical protein
VSLRSDYKYEYQKNFIYLYNISTYENSFKYLSWKVERTQCIWLKSTLDFLQRYSTGSYKIKYQEGKFNGHNEYNVESVGITN